MRPVGRGEHNDTAVAGRLGLGLLEEVADPGLEAPTLTKSSTNPDAAQKKATPASPATARASRVLRVPDGPSRRHPLGILPPRAPRRRERKRRLPTKVRKPPDPAFSPSETEMSTLLVARMLMRSRLLGTTTVARRPSTAVSWRSPPSLDIKQPRIHLCAGSRRTHVGTWGTGCAQCSPDRSAPATASTTCDAVRKHTYPSHAELSQTK
ncbi:hypothetical protein PAHAL_4G156300 [Panicum hallii]|uniref:Uncharacterized protein n=1 Tax=Panicum hallii TaxID=206008 RepID=A0A2T8JCZ7_9POAL|nr:uncharacterized protein LOC112889049 [Panicum hallii]PVH47802.1 hypothetical protein PAHAL_4G156300 [Panicum hallii]